MNGSDSGRARESPETPPTRRDGDAPPSSVAHEAALLADLLAQRGSFLSWAARKAPGTWSPGSPPLHDAASGEPDEGADAPDDERQSSHRHDPAADRPQEASPHDCTCGGQSPAACRVCPVCQVIAFVQKVNPETIDRVADFAAFAATALRDLADARREQPAGPPSSNPPPSDQPASAPPPSPSQPGDDDGRRASP